MKKPVFVSALILLMLILPLLVMAAEAQPTEQQSSVLENEVIIPENLQFLARIFFGIKPDTSVTFQEFIILVVLFFVYLIIFYDIMKLVLPFSNWVSFTLSLGFAFTFSMLGGPLFLTSLILGLGSLFGKLGENSVFNMILAIVLLLVILFIIGTVFKKLKQEKRIQEAGTRGMKAGEKIRLFEKISEIFGSVFGKDT